MQLPLADEWGRTPLHIAVKYGHVNIIKLLLSSRANVNAKDSAEITPLLLAGSNKQDLTIFEDIIEILIEYGANVNVKNHTTGVLK